MRSPHIPGDRFFARIRSLDLECPHCGTVYVLAGGLARTRRTRGRAGDSSAQVREIIWDDILQRFHCRACNRAFGLGIVSWPIRPGSKLRPAEDTIPTPREAMAIRAQAGGFHLRTRTGGDDPRNVVVTQECRCQPDSRTPHPSCPVHGPSGPNLPAVPPKQELGTAGHRPRRREIDYDEEA